MFIITTDKIDGGDAVGTIGPRGVSQENADMLTQACDGKKPPGSVHFKIFDDDGEHYYSGYYVETEDSDEFEPLDCFGGPNAGATSIQTRNDDGSYSVV